jgi:unsaturated rhamnogalacturonyl hydrolase
MEQFRTRIMKLLFILLLATALLVSPAFAQDYFGNWPAGSSPNELGNRLAENWVKRDFEFQNGKRQFLIYPEVCTWYGALVTAKLLKDKDLQSRLNAKFDRFLTTEGAKNISPRISRRRSMSTIT